MATDNTPSPSASTEVGSLSSPADRVAPGESVTDFQARARQRFAALGDVFDFGYWLRDGAFASLSAMTHPSWAPYRLSITEREKEQDNG